MEQKLSRKRKVMTKVGFGTKCWSKCDTKRDLDAN